MGREPASVRGTLPVGRRTGHGRQKVGVTSQESSDGSCQHAGGEGIAKGSQGAVGA